MTNGMSSSVTVSEAAALLSGANHVLILTHQFPDGDTLGSAFALCRGLRAQGKQAQVLCNDAIPEKYEYMIRDLETQEFEPAFVCAVDVADTKLLGKRLQFWGERTNLCIDHHASHREYAEHLLLKADYGATAMIIYEVLTAMHVAVDRVMADCLYTGIATDTGCFKYSNTTPLTHRMAADLMEAGAAAEPINRTMFDIKSRARMSLEKMALQSMTYYYNGRCAVMTVTNDMVKQSGACESDMEGLSPLPRQIEGVWVGITLREKEEGGYKVSVRTGNHADAAAICTLLGGGGHARAAGCAISLPEKQAVEKLLHAIAEAVPAITGD